jgi:hypothetical protein
MLIGGPNQSHKVNFKEPPPERGKDFKENIRILVRQSFSRGFRKKFWKGTLLLLVFFARLARVGREVLNEGSANM